MPMILIRLFRSMVSRDINKSEATYSAAAPTLRGLALLTVVAHGSALSAELP
jgi:hypothetical protein